MNTDFSEQFINSKILACYFKVLCKNFLPPNKTISTSLNFKRAKSNFKVTNFLAQVKRLIGENKCDKESFKIDVLAGNQLEILHLETIWYLEIYSIISIHDFLKHQEKEKKRVRTKE